MRSSPSRLATSARSGGLEGLGWEVYGLDGGEADAERIVEDVVVHELAHLEEADHTDEFWTLVAEDDTEYREPADWLEEHSAELVFTEADR